MRKLAIIITHPIQYYVPVFRLLSKQCTLKVFYTWGEDGAKAKYDPDFKQIISWDLPLLEGYDSEFLNNTAKNPGSHHYNGIRNLDLQYKIESFSTDAILIYGWAYHSHLSVMRYFKGKIPIWFRGDSNVLKEQSGVKLLLRSLFLKWVYLHIDKAFYVGTANKNYYLKFGLKENQLIFAPHAVDNERFALNREAESSVLRQDLNIPVDAVMVLFAGKLEPKKNPELLLQAFIDLNLPNAHLLFVGNGELEEKLRAKKILRQAQDDINERIHFLHFQNQTQMPFVYQACNLFCLPSRSETWGLAVNEAMACGKAILVSNKVGCAVDLVKAGINGEIFQSDNKKDLKNKLLFLANDKARLIEMGQESNKIIQSWSFENQAKQILNLLNETC